MEVATRRIELFQSSGFQGNSYRMVITETFHLGSGLGGPEDTELALQKATEILEEIGINHSLKNCQFTWDGTL